MKNKEHLGKKRRLTDFAGIWAGIPEKEWKEFEQKIADVRKGLNKSLKKKIELVKF